MRDWVFHNDENLATKSFDDVCRKSQALSLKQMSWWFPRCVLLPKAPTRFSLGNAVRRRWCWCWCWWWEGHQQTGLLTWLLALRKKQKEMPKEEADSVWLWTRPWAAAVDLMKPDAWLCPLRVRHFCSQSLAMEVPTRGRLRGQT